MDGQPRRVVARRAPRSWPPSQSAPLSQVAERILDVSDNEGAEVVGHQVGLATSGTGSFEAGAAGVLDTLGGLGIDVAGAEVYDGSGLSRRNRVSTSLLIDLIQHAAGPDGEGCAAWSPGMPVAGFTGSLTYRFAEGPAVARGLVRAKTGTLTGVHALAGIAVDRDGQPLAFVFGADKSRADRAVRRRRRPSTARPPPSPPAAAPTDGTARGDLGYCRMTNHGRLGLRRHRRLPAGRARADVSPDEAAAAVAELRAGADRSTPLVREFTGLHAEAGTAPVLVVDRSGWIQANADGFAKLLAPVVDKLVEKKGPPAAFAEAVGSRVTGAEVGGLLGFLGSKVLGQFDPFHEPYGRLLLVAPNIVHVEREIGVDPHRLPAVGLPARGDPPGAVHRRAVAAPPPVRPQMHAVADTARAQRAARRGSARGRRRASAASDGSLLDLVSTPEQKEILDRVTGVMSLLEGHADVVMDGVGPTVIPSVEEIRAEVQPAPQGRRRRRPAAAPAARPRRQDGAVPRRRRLRPRRRRQGRHGRSSTRSGPAPRTCRPRPRSATPTPGSAACTADAMASPRRSRRSGSPYAADARRPRGSSGGRATVAVACSGGADSLALPAATVFEGARARRCAWSA